MRFFYPVVTLLTSPTSSAAAPLFLAVAAAAAAAAAAHWLLLLLLLGAGLVSMAPSWRRSAHQSIRSDRVDRTKFVPRRAAITSTIERPRLDSTQHRSVRY